MERREKEQTGTGEPPRRDWSVTEVAEMAGVTVRTLHHYDDIGLLPPAGRSDGGHRRYGASQLQRLHRIVLYRELGFTLDEVCALLDADSFTARRLLQERRSGLVAQQERTDAVIRAVDRALHAMETELEMSEKDLQDAFRDLPAAPDHVREHHETHADEVIREWGRGDAFRSSARRVKDYSAEDWNRINLENERQLNTMIRLLRQGAEPQGAEARAGAEAMRLHIDRWYYPCSSTMHAALADMYESDVRFRSHYDERATGLAAFVASAIRANAETGSA